MLRLEFPSQEGFDETRGKFVTAEAMSLELEHCLFSVSKWEAKHKVAFLSDKKLTEDQTRDYIRMMNLGADFPDSLFDRFTFEHYDAIRLYIDDRMTATIVPEDKAKPSRDKVTAELIYYWMISLGIPFECQYWHIDRLLTLIKLCNLKNQEQSGKKKPVTRDTLAERRALNEQRRRELGSAG